MSDEPPLVYLDLALEGLKEALEISTGQLVRADDHPGPDRRARVKVLVTGGPTHLPIDRVESFPGLTTVVSVAAGHDGHPGTGVRRHAPIGEQTPDGQVAATGQRQAIAGARRAHTQTLVTGDGDTVG